MDLVKSLKLNFMNIANNHGHGSGCYQSQQSTDCGKVFGEASVESLAYAIDCDKPMRTAGDMFPHPFLLSNKDMILV